LCPRFHNTSTTIIRSNSVNMKAFRRFLHLIELPEEEQGDRWSNADTLPVPPEKRTWGSLQYIELWFLVFMNLSAVRNGPQAAQWQDPSFG
jgi:cytosine/uracil/thiamine/allantoin permease